MRKPLLLLAILILCVPATGRAHADGAVGEGMFVGVSPSGAEGVRVTAMSGTIWTTEGRNDSWVCADLINATASDSGCGPGTVTVDPSLASARVEATIPSIFLLHDSVGLPQRSASMLTVSVSVELDVIPDSEAGLGFSASPFWVRAWAAPQRVYAFGESNAHSARLGVYASDVLGVIARDARVVWLSTPTAPPGQ